MKDSRKTFNLFRSVAYSDLMIMFTYSYYFELKKNFSVVVYSIGQDTNAD